MLKSSNMWKKRVEIKPYKIYFNVSEIFFLIDSKSIMALNS
jgi:hypothetical protein